jgi:hypothetical protein
MRKPAIPILFIETARLCVKKLFNGLTIDMLTCCEHVRSPGFRQFGSATVNFRRHAALISLRDAASDQIDWMV